MFLFIFEKLTPSLNILHMKYKQTTNKEKTKPICFIIIRLDAAIHRKIKSILSIADMANIIVAAKYT
ncbi:hypothetical protein, partial [Yersinia rochesterensis]|uniref:hypothetical protein n=1 Tax=Yersinia rochesterensis TaxID=1604335 RepID=UPI001C989CB2